MEQNPTFSQYRKVEDTTGMGEQQAHHLALVKLVSPEALDDCALRGIGLTLSQLCRLSMTPCVVLDCRSYVRELGQFAWRQEMTSQAERLAKAIEKSSGSRVRILDNVYSLFDSTSPPGIFSRKLLMSPIRRGQIPIILPLAYSEETQAVRKISAQQAILTLTREFAGFNSGPLRAGGPATTARRPESIQQQTSLDRLIILDPQGGIPRPSGWRSNHVFLNMEQEYDDVRKELLDHIEGARPFSSTHPTTSEEQASRPCPSGLHASSPQVHHERPAQDVVTRHLIPPRSYEDQAPGHDLRQHLENLDLVREVLTYLPASSSAIVTTPLEAARSSRSSAQPPSISAVGTRTQKNPLIHNLLTDKPAYSASLPIGRLGRWNDPGNAPPVVATPTFAKRGMPLTMIPDPRVRPWTVYRHDEPRLKLTDPRIDLPRLVYLIEDSFNRKLDVEHYLNRVNDRVAGLIIAGEYEGGALFTWETPPGASASEPRRQVPYLDKFAVLKRSQGAGGVADIVFNAMVRGCFPNGVCWRSRRDNPVNKWYFERARGTWQLPGTNWAMFWTTEGVEAGDGQIFKDYGAVCRGVEPSWADQSTVAD